MSNLVIRSIAGILFSIVVIGSALLGQEAVACLFLFFSIVGLHEFYTITKSKGGHNPRYNWGIFIGMAVYGMTYGVSQNLLPIHSLWILGFITTIFMTKELYRLDAAAFSNLAITLFGVGYISIPFAGVNVLSMYSGSFSYVLPVGFFLILWANDTGAYLIGRWLGKTKLYPEVSPNKTWEGLAGGVFMAMASGMGLYFLFEGTLALRDWIVIAVIISIFGNLGDLLESHLKRTFGVKDSGHLIPGHGGVLDRFDGLLLSMPVVLAYLYLIREF